MLHHSYLHAVTYIWLYLLPLAPSVVHVVILKYSFPDDASQPYNMTVSCTIHPDSTADYCVLTAVRDDSNVTRVGE